MIGSGVKAKCPKCDKDADANSFQLDYKFGKMVCQNCFNNRNKPVKSVIEKSKPNKPAGWDKEDELLEQITREKRSQLQGIVEKVPGENFVMINCPNCNYKFKFDLVRRKPGYCPYCSQENPRIKVSGTF